LYRSLQAQSGFGRGESPLCHEGLTLEQALDRVEFKNPNSDCSDVSQWFDARAAEVKVLGPAINARIEEAAEPRVSFLN
jgi:hypothetical protein